MVGRQELEIILGEAHISFTTTKLGSLMQVQQSQDPDGLRIFYYLVQVWASIGLCGNVSRWLRLDTALLLVCLTHLVRELECRRPS